MASRWVVVVGVVVACAGCAAIVGLSDPGDAPPGGPQTDSASGSSSGGAADGPTEGGGTTNIGYGSGRDGPLLVADRRPINEYFPLAKNADVGARSLTLGKRDANTTIIAVRPGDLLLVIQSAMFGLKPDSGAYPLKVDEIGTWELVSVDNVNGDVVETAAPLVHAFSASGGQIVLVKQYTTVEIAAAGAISAPRWDGFSGGVIAFLATGSVIVNGQIDATNGGFRGARVAQLGAGLNNCTPLEGLVDAGFAPRGEGYGSGDAGYGGLTGGRGNFGNGGGGGNCHNSGGAGGGNGGRGGGGGDSFDLARPVGGLGGADLALTPGVARLRFGGGGGAGESNDNQQGNGGSGGGVIFVRAPKLTGTGFVYARGGGGGTTSGDGAGGGGAGGTVYLDIAESPGCKAIGINGGGGGNVNGGTGPGGGGGGGVVYLKGVLDSGTADASTCPIEWNAGAPGTDGVTRRGAGPPDNERGETPYVGVASEDLAP